MLFFGVTLWFIYLQSCSFEPAITITINLNMFEACLFLDNYIPAPHLPSLCGAIQHNIIHIINIIILLFSNEDKVTRVKPADFLVLGVKPVVKASDGHHDDAFPSHILESSGNGDGPALTDQIRIHTKY